MKELLEHIISSLIDIKYFEIEENIDGNNIRYNLKVDPEFIGMIIGKEGKTVRSIRNILRIKAVLENKVVFLEVTEKGEKSESAKDPEKSST